MEKMYEFNLFWVFWWVTELGLDVFRNWMQSIFQIPVNAIPLSNMEIIGAV